MKSKLIKNTLFFVIIASILCISSVNAITYDWETNEETQSSDPHYQYDDEVYVKKWKGFHKYDMYINKAKCFGDYDDDYVLKKVEFEAYSNDDALFKIKVHRYLNGAYTGESFISILSYDPDDDPTYYFYFPTDPDFCEFDNSEKPNTSFQFVLEMYLDGDLFLSAYKWVNFG